MQASYPLNLKKRKTVFRSECPICVGLDVFGDKWSLLVIRDMLFNGKNSFGDFLKSGEKIATNILADRLELLECAGIISKKPHPENKTRIVYRLTPKGIDLAPVLLEIIAWSGKHHKVHPQAAGFAEAIRKDKAAVLAELYRKLKDMEE